MSIDRDEVMGHAAIAPFVTANIATFGNVNFVATTPGWTECLVSGVYSTAGPRTVVVTVGVNQIYVFCSYVFNFVIKLYPNLIPTINVSNQGATNCFVNVTLIRNRHLAVIQVT